MEHIPTHLLDLIERIPFEQLESAQRTEILSYLSAEEYRALHQASQLTRADLREESARFTVADYPSEKLMAAFAHKHATPVSRIIPLWQRNLALWKVAASWVLIAGSSWLWFQSKHRTPQQPLALTQVDTVYIEKIVKLQPSLVHDTVVLIKELVKPAQEIQPPEEASAQPLTYNQHPTRENLQVSGSVPGMRILTIRDKDNALNNKAGVAVADDTLVKKHSFITL